MSFYWLESTSPCQGGRDAQGKCAVSKGKEVRKHKIIYIDHKVETVEATDACQAGPELDPQGSVIFG